MAEPVLSIRGLCKSFGALVANEDVSLDLLPRTIHALIGPNGAGKSTLIRQIAGDMKPESGSVYFRGRDVSGLDTVQRARLGLTRTFQISSLIPEFSVLENVLVVLLARERQVFDLVRPARRFAGPQSEAATITGRAGLAGREHVSAEDLSHAERRRLELTMALAMKPHAFLLDEPMAGMGQEGSREMTSLLDDLRHEAPILLIEHDMDAVFRLADRISVLVSGRIIASGTPQDIRSDPLVRDAYLGEGAAV